MIASEVSTATALGVAYPGLILLPKGSDIAIFCSREWVRICGDAGQGSRTSLSLSSTCLPNFGWGNMVFKVAQRAGSVGRASGSDGKPPPLISKHYAPNILMTKVAHKA